MKVFVGYPRSGKTLAAIKQAAQTNSYLVVATYREARRVADIAKENNIKINFPLTFDELLDGRYHGPGIKSIVIDNVDSLLRQVVPDLQINMVTLCAENIEEEDR